MRFQFVDNFPFSFGVSSLSATLKSAGHEVGLSNYRFSKWKPADSYLYPEKYYDFDKIADDVLATNPDLVGFSLYCANYHFYRNLAAKIKARRPRLPILVGGVFPTLSPDFIMEDSQCNFIFRGEAENAIVEVVEGIERGDVSKLPNLVYRFEDRWIINPISSYVSDMDALPWDDLDLYSGSFNTLFFMTSRGCVFDCSYCSSGRYTILTTEPGTGKVRKMSARKTVEKLKAALRGRNYKDIMFFDDFFISGKAWLKEFADLYVAEIGLPYGCIAFPATINAEIAKILADSGCVFVCMGFQTANESYKLTALNRVEKNANVLRAIEHLRAHGMTFSLDHIFNLPGETEEDLRLSLNFYLDHGIRNVGNNFLNYYPASDITEYALKHGHVSLQQYNLINRNRMIGDQSCQGTIVDPLRSKRQVQWAMLYMLGAWLPAKLVKRMADMKIHHLFPAGRYVFFGAVGLTAFRIGGIPRIKKILEMWFAWPPSGKKEREA